MRGLPTCTGIVAVIKPPVTWEKFDLPGQQILSCDRAKIEHERRMKTIDSYFFAEEVSTRKSHKKKAVFSMNQIMSSYISSRIYENRTIGLQESTLFKAAISSKCPEQWSNYKRVRNEVTSDLRKAKSSYFSIIFNEVKSSSAYWNLLKRATNPKVRKNIGKLKKDDSTLDLRTRKSKPDELLFCYDWPKAIQHFTPAYKLWTRDNLRRQGRDGYSSTHRCLRFKVISSGQNKGAKNKKIHGS